MPAASLEEAARTAYVNLQQVWAANTLQAALTGFNNDLIAVFPRDGTIGERTVSNWLVIGTMVRNAMAASPPRLAVNDFNDAAEYVYRLCWAADVAETDGRISPAQAAAILAAYNVRFP